MLTVQTVPAAPYSLMAASLKQLWLWEWWQRGGGGEGVQSIHPKDRGAGRGLQLPGATSRVSQQSHRLPDLLQHHRTLHLPVTVMSAKNKINL